MLSELITVLDAALNGTRTAERYGLVERREVAPGQYEPMQHTGGGQWKKVATDKSGSWSYFRQISNVRYDNTEAFTGCFGVRAKFTLRFIALLNIANDGPCANPSQLTSDLVASLRANKKTARQAIGAQNVDFTAIAAVVDSDAITTAEFGAKAALPTDRQLLALDMEIEVKAEDNCLPVCEPAVQVLIGPFCDLVQNRTAAVIFSCLTDEQKTELTALLT